MVPPRAPRASIGIAYVRSLLKKQVELALSSPAAGAIARHRVRGKRLILAYHGIVPDGATPAGERALFITQREFAAQLDVLAATTDVAPLDRIDEIGDGRPRVAITFDDAYRGAVKEGVRELAIRGLPATIFVAPGRLNGHVFWWDALSHECQALEEEVRVHAVHALGGSDERVRAWAARARLASSDALPAYAKTATRAELRDAVAVPGISVGSHSWSHANLASLAAHDIAMEVERPRDWLLAEFGAKALPWLAYPYGLESEEARRAVASASYVGALRIGGGWHRAADTSPLARPRLSIPGNLSLAGFRARLLGAIGS
jgi:peptidoglycan/xylan/chitin deacetylase (PgdA/CDA1 family)